jgi:hypothetical protein
MPSENSINVSIEKKSATQKNELEESEIVVSNSRQSSVKEKESVVPNFEQSSLSESVLHEFQFIFTFEDKGQEFKYIDIKDKNTKDKKSFLSSIFGTFDDQKKLKSLIKISTMQLDACSYETLVSVLRENNGKFYFNVDVNDDDDTKENLQIKSEYIKNNLLSTEQHHNQ